MLCGSRKRRTIVITYQKDRLCDGCKIYSICTWIPIIYHRREILASCPCGECIVKSMCDKRTKYDCPEMHKFQRFGFDK